MTTRSPRLYRPVPGDYVLAVLLIAGCVGGMLFAHAKPARRDGRALVCVDGHQTRALPLARDAVLPLSAGEKHITLEVKDGRIRIAQSDCPRQICVRQGWISKPSEMIACAPAKVLIKIEGDAGMPDVDAVTD